tara:strand:+ start:432 stop:674 length:243 start_codon:yes stop_codon:yes gene_type:complete
MAKKNLANGTPLIEPKESHVSPFMNTIQAAEYLLLSPKTLEKMRWHGNGPSYRKHAAIVVYHIDDLKTWSSSTQRNSTSE